MAQSLDVRDEVPSGVGVERRVWSRSAAPALIEQEHAVARRIEQPPMIGRAAPARAAVQNHRGPAARMAAQLPSDRVAIRDIENARGVRLDRRIGMAALCVGREVTMRATFPLCRSSREVAFGGPESRRRWKHQRLDHHRNGPGDF